VQVDWAKIDIIRVLPAKVQVAFPKTHDMSGLSALSQNLPALLQVDRLKLALLSNETAVLQFHSKYFV
jgi:hypothetical protein